MKPKFKIGDKVMGINKERTHFIEGIISQVYSNGYYEVTGDVSVVSVPGKDLKLVEESDPFSEKLDKLLAKIKAAIASPSSEPKTWDNLVPGEDVVIDDRGGERMFLGQAGVVMFFSKSNDYGSFSWGFTKKCIEEMGWKIKQPEPPKEEPTDEVKQAIALLQEQGYKVERV